ncbi:MAG TPA: hypothetical protein VNJ05_00380 [Sphingomicrobium sp.]|nr:hypothetical protein [Sphingomicrobium sp.]
MHCHPGALLGCAISVLVSGPANAQSSDSQELARKLSNPVASLISVPFQENLDWGGGVDGGGFQAKLNIQPFVPVGISTDSNLIIRTILPVIYQNDVSAPGKSEFGLGDTVQSFFYSPKAPTSGGIIWGAGPVFLYPTATSKYTGGKKWGAGPTIVLLKQSGQSTFGLLANHIWSVAGDDDRPDVSASFLNPFYSYTTKKATTFSLNTEGTYDWKSDKWIVPINANVSQLVRVGKQPMSFGMGGRYYVSSPTGGPHWGLRFTTTLLFPKK